MPAISVDSPKLFKIHSNIIMLAPSRLHPGTRNGNNRYKTSTAIMNIKIFISITSFKINHSLNTATFQEMYTKQSIGSEKPCTHTHTYCKI